MSFSDEAECGYMSTETRAWRELRWSMSWLRPGGKFIKIKALIPRLSCKKTWVFKMVVNETPGCVQTCLGNILFKEGKLQWQTMLLQVKKSE